MFNVELLSDRVAAASLEKRRNRELQRQDKIFNSKVRTIGIDPEALERQVNEKRQKAEEEKESLNIYAADMVRNDKVACLLDNRQVKEDRMMEKAIVDFRQHFQQPQCQREYDLNDPELLRKADRDSTQMMPPGLLGEDPGSQARLKRQKEQLREWSIQQQHERAVARQQQRLGDQQYEHSRVDLDNKAIQLQRIEGERRKAVTIATKDYNLAKAAENREMRRQEWKQDEEDKQVDILNHLQGELMAEDSEPTLGVLGVPRLRPSVGKRAPPKELQELVQFQKYQAEERKMMELEKKQNQQQQDGLRLNWARTALLLERQQDRLNRQLRRDLDHTNARLAQVHKQQKKACEKESINSLDDGYFSKFNTSSR